MEHEFQQLLDEGVNFTVPQGLFAPMGEFEWEELVLSGSQDLEERLTPAQQAIVASSGSLLVSGVAGSGKTTVALFWLLRQVLENNAPRGLYITHNPWLAMQAQRIFERIIARHELPGGEWRERIAFASMSSLLAQLEPHLPQPIGRERWILPQELEQARGIRESKLPLPLVWGEIQSIIKGACLDPNKPLLDREAYESLGQKRAPHLVEYRKEVHRLARRYQEYLEEQNLIDELDAVRLALAHMPGEWKGRFAAVACDETQDLTTLHLELLVNTLSKDGTLLATGDLNQILHPSGFRWSEVRERFYAANRTPPQEPSLDENFRSVGAIVRLANAVLSLRRRLLGGELSSASEPTMPGGDAPRLLNVPEEDLKQAIATLDARQAVIARSKAQRDKLRRDTGCAFIFTVEEVKGLEFDLVLIWDFFAPDRSTWEAARRKVVRPADAPGMRQAFNQLYVAATRARRSLRIYAPLGDLWDEPELAVLTVQTREAALDMGTPIRPETWLDRGHYFSAQGFHTQAVVCFERAGRGDLVLRAQAEEAYAAGRLSESARRFREAGDPARAAKIKERQRVWGEAAADFLAADMPDDARRCEAAAAKGDFVTACRIQIELGRHADAVSSFKRVKSGPLREELSTLLQAAGVPVEDKVSARATVKGKERLSETKSQQPRKAQLYQVRALNKSLFEPAEFRNEEVTDLYIGFCDHPRVFNQAYCHVVTEGGQYTFWAPKPFKKREFGSPMDREWFQTFDRLVANGKSEKVHTKFSLKTIVPGVIEPPGMAFFESADSQEAIDQFVIEGYLRTKTGRDLPYENIQIQLPSY